MAENIRVEAYFSGHVQGVGFRFTTMDIADRFRGIAGYVRNTRDGRVELVAEGPADQVNGFVAAVTDAMGGYIRGVEKRELPAAGGFSGFGVAR